MIPFLLHQSTGLQQVQSLESSTKAAATVAGLSPLRVRSKVLIKLPQVNLSHFLNSKSFLVVARVAKHGTWAVLLFTLKLTHLKQKLTTHILPDQKSLQLALMLNQKELLVPKHIHTLLLIVQLN